MIDRVHFHYQRPCVGDVPLLIARWVTDTDEVWYTTVPIIDGQCMWDWAGDIPEEVRTALERLCDGIKTW